MTGTDPRPFCPVCKEHGKQAAAESEGVVLTGVEAVLKGDVDTLAELYKTLTPFDAHAAISLYAALLFEAGLLLGLDVNVVLAHYRRRVNAKLAKTEGTS